MCGITGIYNLDGQAVSIKLLVRITQVLRHRGPDDEGFVLLQAKISDGSAAGTDMGGVKICNYFNSSGSVIAIWKNNGAGG